MSCENEAERREELLALREAAMDYASNALAALSAAEDALEAAWAEHEACVSSEYAVVREINQLLCTDEMDNYQDALNARDDAEREFEAAAAEFEAIERDLIDADLDYCNCMRQSPHP